MTTSITTPLQNEIIPCNPTDKEEVKYFNGMIENKETNCICQP